MPCFRYTAKTADGATVKDRLEAVSERAARDELLDRNLEVTKLGPVRTGFLHAEITPQRVKKSEIMHFSRQMAAFVAAGIPLTDGLQVIAGATQNKRWREVLDEASEAIAQGAQFSDALEPNAGLFPSYYLGIVRAAEMTGRLDLALDQLSQYLERDLETRSRINQALAYPSVVFCMAIATVSILTIWVLPKFADFFNGLGAKLPLSTRMLIGLSNFSKNYWWVYAAALAAVTAAVLYVWRSRRGRRWRDRVSLRIPVVREVVLFSVVERISRILGAMSRAGVPLPDAMAAAMRGANNSVFEEGLQEVQVRMLEGEGLANPIADTGLFPEAAVQMMRVGENTGTLDVQLENASDFYSRELQYKLKRLTTLFEPVVIVIMGVIVGFVAIALVQAMYGIYSTPTFSNIR